MAIINNKQNNEQPIIAWFSCGATSAIATMLAIRHFENVLIYRIVTGCEHEDNERFMRDCEEKLFQKKVHIARSDHYADVMDVIRKKRFINSPYGAACTYELKKRVRYSIEDKLVNWAGQVYGFDIKERKRAQRFYEQYPATKPLFPLIEHNLSKADCLALLAHYDIKLPAMYQLGYNNNNCIGCVKGGQGYWNMIRKDFPKTFNDMASLERKIGHSCIKDIFLDELPIDSGRKQGVMPECSIFCALEFI